MYAGSKAPPYTAEIFEDVGRAFCVGLLDYIEENPVSRIPLSSFKTLEGIKNDILSHNRIIIPKQKPDLSETATGDQREKSQSQVRIKSVTRRLPLAKIGQNG